MAALLRVLKCQIATKWLSFCICVIFLLSKSLCHEINKNTLRDFTYKGSKTELPTNVRFLLYDVNSGEGFNLRRDVYMRIANLVVSLNAESPWILVLPAWNHLYHWQTEYLHQTQLLWSTFFDLDSLNRHVPVLEFEDYLEVTGQSTIDEVYYLQRYKEGWTDGKFDEKMDIRPCIDRNSYKKISKDLWGGYFFGFNHVTTGSFKCLSVQGDAGILKPFLLKNTTVRSVFIDRAETVLHDMYGSKLFWQARRSMRYAEPLRDIGDTFRREALDSTDEKDGTELEPWWSMQRQYGHASGGPFICAHLRRKDFLRSHSKYIPSLQSAASQIHALLVKYNLMTVFISSDMSSYEFSELLGHMKNVSVIRYIPPQDVLDRYKDGGVSVIDQWICAHATHFTGSHVSTFSFRIQEDREILGFRPETTFNCLCGGNKSECEQPAKWMIAYTDSKWGLGSVNFDRDL